jgi:hypothetical protein
MRIQKAINELVDYVAENDKLTISFDYQEDNSNII